MFEFLKRKPKKEKQPQYLLNGAYGAPKWSTNKDYDYVSEAYNKVVWVYSCVSIIASNVSTVPWELYKVGNTNEKQIFEHPILNMLNNQVNAHMTSKDFFDLWATYLATQGKFYGLFNNASLPTEIYPLYPHKTKPIPDKSHYVSGFEYDTSRQRILYNQKEVLWSKFTDPLDYYEGLSPIKSMARTIDTENEAVDWNKSQLQNQGVPSGVLQVVNPSPELKENLRHEWLSRYAGSKNARVPLVLNAEKANYQSLGLSAIDMDFLNQRKLSRVEICAGFKVPSQVVGDPEGQTYSNYGEAVKSLWNQCLIPNYLDRMKDALNLYVAKKYNERFEIRYNLDNVGALQENQDALMKRAIDGYEKGLLTQNEGRTLVGYDEVEGGNKFYMPAPAPVQADKSFKFKSIDTDKKKVMWKSIEDKRQRYEDGVVKQFEKLFKDENKRIQESIKDATQSNITSKVNEQIDKGRDDKLDVMRAMYLLLTNEFGNDSYNKVAKLKQDEIDFISDFVREYLWTLTAQKVTMIDDTTRDEIQSVIEDGVDEGLSIDDIAENINRLYLEQIIPNRSVVIARTETVGASNYGSLEGAQRASIDFGVNVKKIWLPTADSRTRDTHRAMFEHPAIGLSESFTVGNSQMQHPGDPLGSAEEVIQCRCAIGYERGED